MTILLVVFSLLLGVCVGSFVNVVIYRTLRGLSPYSGRSFCDSCKRQLSWFENIPLASYLALGGRCRTCKKKIDSTYPVVELVTGLLFVWWATLGFAFFHLSPFGLSYLQPGFWLLVGIILVIVFFADVIYGIIPDLTIVVLGLATILYRGYLVYVGEMRVGDLLVSVLTGVAAMGFFLALYLGTRGKGLGFGDVKFSLVMGLLLGFPRALIGFFVSFLIGGIYGIGMLLLKRKKFGQTLPFGPFMIVGIVVALLWGGTLWRWYMGMLGM